MADGKHGRPTIYTPELGEKFLGLMREGLYLDDAAAICRVNKQTVYDWITRGEAGEEPFASFVDSYKEAETEAKRESLSTVRKGQQGWQANAWFLERRHRQGWGRDARNDEQAQTPAPQVIVVQVPKAE